MNETYTFSVRHSYHIARTRRGPFKCHDSITITEYFVNGSKIQSIEGERFVLDLARKRGGGLV